MPAGVRLGSSPFFHTVPAQCCPALEQVCPVLPVCLIRPSDCDGELVLTEGNQLDWAAFETCSRVRSLFRRRGPLPTPTPSSQGHKMQIPLQLLRASKRGVPQRGPEGTRKVTSSNKWNEGSSCCWLWLVPQVLEEMPGQ